MSQPPINLPNGLPSAPCPIKPAYASQPNLSHANAAYRLPNQQPVNSNYYTVQQNLTKPSISDCYNSNPQLNETNTDPLSYSNKSNTTGSITQLHSNIANRFPNQIGISLSKSNSFPNSSSNSSRTSSPSINLAYKDINQVNKPISSSQLPPLYQTDMQKNNLIQTSNKVNSHQGAINVNIPNRNESQYSLVNQNVCKPHNIVLKPVESLVTSANDPISNKIIPQLNTTFSNPSQMRYTQPNISFTQTPSQNTQNLTFTSNSQTYQTHQNVYANQEKQIPHTSSNQLVNQPASKFNQVSQYQQPQFVKSNSYVSFPEASQIPLSSSQHLMQKPPTSGGYSKSEYPPLKVGYQQYPTSNVEQPPTVYNQQIQAPPLSARYPSQPQMQQYVHNPQMQQFSQQYQNQQIGNLNQQMGNMSVAQSGFNSLWGQETIDLMQNRTIVPAEKIQPPPIRLQHQFQDAINCNPDLFRCTVTKIPETNSLLQKCRLPLGVLIHPFRDLGHLPVIQCTTIVRCRACRTYINPFVHFVDSKKWKCNLCYRVNELPDEFQYDPVSKSYGDPTRRPEVKSATIEFIAPSEYMLRPPQPAVYLFLMDTSRLAIESHYLDIACKEIHEHLDELPGDGRTQVGFICYNSQVHFYNMAEGLTRPHEITVLDIDDVFLPCPDNLLVNLNERKTQVMELLGQLPSRFIDSHDTGSALGSALQAAYKLMAPTGGRISVFHSCLPNKGPGTLTAREDPNNRSSGDVAHLGPATDFYKRLALDCSGQQIAVDLFLLNSQYADLATLSGISRFSGGCIYHLPLFKADREIHAGHFRRVLTRYLTRKIGFEAVMRVRCTRGMSIHTFHGNFFVRSTDLLSLPNVNPDAGFGMQLSIDESLQDAQTVCLQAALLYTSSKGERRIRVHTLCLPVSNSMSDIMHSADQQCIVGLLSKMAVDRSLQSNLSDARDAFMNVCVDILGAFKIVQNLPSGYNNPGLAAPQCLKLLPLYIHALMKHVAFRTGQSTRLDDRIYAMCEMKSLPLDQLIKQVYPDFYPLHYLNENETHTVNDDGSPLLPKLQLTAEKLDSRGLFLLDSGPSIIIYIGSNISPALLQNMLGHSNIAEVKEISYEIPILNTDQNRAAHSFIKSLNDEKPCVATIQIVRDNGAYRTLFTEKLIDDRLENSLSYYEFLQHLKTLIK